MKTAAIYARRSKLTEKGDSIESQIKMCSSYLNNLDISNIRVYKDEGFSGKNTERPEFLQMIKDAKQKKFDVLICYKLDRISRNVSDFSTLINDLERLNIAFISVTEQFETSSAMGKAMMYICSVFGQLERETISQRIKDNMYSLATIGYWLGGECPTGFSSKRNSFIDSGGKERTYSILVPIPDEINLVKLIYSKYLELGSLSQVEKYMLSHNIKTKNNKDWSKNSIRELLSNPAYVRANEETINYLNSCGITTYGTPNGTLGLLIYKKRQGKNGRRLDVSHWIYSISNHEGIIESDKWILVQKLLKANKSKAPALGTSHNALLSGLIRCGQCNSYMRVAYGTKLPNSDKKRFYYMCSLKHNSGKTRCNSKNINGLELDQIVLNKLKEMSLDKNSLIKELKKYKANLENSTENIVLKNLTTDINKNNDMISNLLNNLSLTTDPDIATMFLDRITALKEENTSLEGSLKDLYSDLELQKELINNCDSIIDKLKNFSKFVDTATVPAQRKLIATIIDCVTVNGTTGSVNIKFKAL